MSTHEGPGKPPGFSDSLDESRRRVAEFQKTVPERLGGSKDEDPSSSIDATPEIVLTAEDKGYLSGLGLSNTEIEGLDHDELIDIFHARHNEHFQASPTGSNSGSIPDDLWEEAGTHEVDTKSQSLQDLKWTPEQYAKLPPELIDRILADKITPEQAFGPAAPKAEPAFAHSTVEQRLRLGRELGWSVADRNKLDKVTAQRVLDHGLRPEEVLSGVVGAKEADETSSELKTRMRRTVLDLDSLSKEQQKEKYARVFSDRTSARESHQKEVVALMEAAARENKIAEDAVEAHFAKSNKVMNTIRDIDLKDYLPKDVQEKVERAERARHAVLARTLGTVAERRAARGGDPSYDQKVNDRYTRRYGILQKVVIEPMKAQERARAAGLEVREIGAIEGWIDKHYLNLPPYQRILATSAVITGISAALGGAVIVPLAFAGASAVASVAASYIEKKGWGKTAATGVATIASVGGLLGLAANLITKGAHHLAGTKSKAKERLDSKGLIRKDGSYADVSDWDTYKKELEMYRRALKAEQEVKRDAALFGGVGSVIAGQTLGHQVSDVVKHEFGEIAHGHLPFTHHDPVPVPATEPGVASQTSGVVAPNPENAPPPETAVSAETPEASSHSNVEGVIGKGEGADAAFNDLQTKLRVEYAGVAPDDLPAAVKEVLGANSPNELSRHFGFAWDDHSRTMQEGDTIGIEDEKLVYSHGDEHHVLMDDSGRHALDHTEPTPRHDAPESPRHEAPVPRDHGPVEDTPPVIAESSVEDAAPAADVQPVAPPVAEASSASPQPNTPAGASGSYSPEEVVRMTTGAQAESVPGIPGPMNAFDVYIDPSEGHLYNFRLPGTDQEYVAVFGGRQDALDDVALTYLKEHPDAVVLFDSPQTELDGSTHYRLDAFRLGPDGAAQSVPNYTDGVIPPGTKLDPEQFTRPIRP